MGVSKHYVLTTIQKNFVDYEIPVEFNRLIPELLRGPLRNELIGVFETIHRGPASWRRKIKDMWALLPLETQRNFRLTEYLVYPHRSHKICNWRRMVGGIRKRPAKPILYINPEFEREPVLVPRWVEQQLLRRLDAAPGGLNPIPIPNPPRPGRFFRLAFEEAV